MSTLSATRTFVAGTIGLLPLAIAIMTLVLLLFFRRVLAVVLTMAEVLACLVFVFGLMGFTGVPVYLTIAVMPIILTAVGIADEIHIYHRYRTLARADALPRDVTQRVGLELASGAPRIPAILIAYPEGRSYTGEESVELLLPAAPVLVVDPGFDRLGG